MEIIPAIDIINGKCVRLTQGDYNQQKVYNENPADVAKMYEDHGFNRLHVVDLDGAKAKRIINHKVLEKIASATNLIIDFGGGLKSDYDLQVAFNSGANMITGGSVAVKNPEMFINWLATYGNEKIILGADVKEKKIAVNGWTEQTSHDIIHFIQGYYEKGIRKVICTDISRDGMLSGTSNELYQEILSAIPAVFLTASGGVSSIQDLKKLNEIGVDGVIVGKAIYEGKIELNALSKFQDNIK